MLSVTICFSWLLALSTARPLNIQVQRKGFATAQHVLIIGFDGLGGMYLENATSFLPNFAKFYKSGAVTTRARNQMPSFSGPNWCSIITGQGPEESGVPNNGWVPPDNNDSVPYKPPPISGAGKIPETMWRTAKEQNSQVVTASIEPWDWIHRLVEPGMVDHE